MKISRRQFGKKVISITGTLGAGLVCPGLLKAKAPGNNRVILARSPKLKRIDHDIDGKTAAAVLAGAMQKLTGAASAAAAWKILFASHERVGLKLSCLPGKPLSSSPGLVAAIVEGLLDAGLSEHNIFVWERSRRELERAGFSAAIGGVRVIGTDSPAGGGYSDSIEFSGTVGTCFSRIVERLDAIINVPVLKDHDIAGVSIGMKNFYGAIYNPNKFHGNRCDPYVADLYNHRFIRQKCRLTVCDASRIQVHNGPAFYPRYAREFGGLLVGMDPVALDFTGWQIIERERREMGLKSLTDSGREPTYIRTAAGMGLGRADRRQIDLIEL